MLVRLFDLFAVHTALNNITPYQAISFPKKREHIMHLNILKTHDNGFVTDLNSAIKSGLMTHYYLKSAQRAVGVMKYMLYTQSVGSP